MKKAQIKDTDPDFKNQVASMPGGENIRKCFSCGTCTGICPVFQVEEEYNPRKIIRMILLGMKKEVLSSKMIWLCARCYACTAHCPQQVSFADIMAILRDMAVSEGYASADLPDRIEEINLSANAFRRDCINLVNNPDKTDSGKILEKTQQTVDKLKKS